MITTQTAKVFQTMLGADLIPRVPYPGSSEPWPCLHTVCGREVTPRYSNIQIGRGGCPWCAGNAPITPEQAAEVMKRGGFTLLGDFAGTQSKNFVRHDACGKSSLIAYSTMRDGAKYCSHCLPNRKQNEEQALATVHELQFSPLEPYPESTQVKWLLKCDVCGYEVRKSVNQLRAAYKRNPDWRGCRPCGVEKRVAASRLTPDGKPWKPGDVCLRPSCSRPATNGGYCASDYVMQKTRARKGA